MSKSKKALPSAQTIHNVFIIDRSGSMSNVRDMTISGFNENVQTTKDIEKKFPNQKHTVSLITFNHEINEQYYFQETSHLTEMDSSTYIPTGNTALYDAIGKSISHIESNIQSGDKVSIMIFTDGYENSSKEYRSYDQISSHITRLQVGGDWSFVFIGADNAVLGQAKKLGINTTLNYSTKGGLDKGMNAVLRTRTIMASTLNANPTGNLEDLTNTVYAFTDKNDVDSIVEPSTLNPLN